MYRYTQYSAETRAEAIRLINSGLSITEVSCKLRIIRTTLNAWIRSYRNPRQLLCQKYPKEIKEKARELVKSGIPRRRAAVKLNVGRSTVNSWTKDLPNNRYPVALKYGARRLVKRGLTRKEAATLLHLDPRTVRWWTQDLGCNYFGYSFIGRSTLRILSELFTRGYVFCGDEKVSLGIYRTLRKYFGIKRVKIRIPWYKATVLYLKGRESDAFSAYAKRVKINYLDTKALERVKKLFV